jgi:hypothetical protein
MGQRIEIEDRRVVDDSVIFATNRGLTGADGEGYASPEEASEAQSFGARLASDLFESVEGVSRVFVSSNMVVVRGGDAWNSENLQAASTVIEDFFLHY